MAVTSAMIRQWHTSPPPVGRGWRQVGYSRLIHRNGIVETLVGEDGDDEVDPWEITNGVGGINFKSVHVCYVGGREGKHKKVNLDKRVDTRTLEQNASLELLVRDYIKRVPDIEIAGHRQFNALKACPSFDVPKWLRSIGIPEKNIYDPTRKSK